MSKFIDRTGHRYGRLVVLRLAPTGRWGFQWLCRCDCGAVVEVATRHIGRGTNSCGCLKFESRNGTHGEGLYGKRTVEYQAWRAMIARCENPKRREWKNYGGRGIAVCEEWRYDYPAFLAHVGRRPSADLSIDRWPDPDGNYEPGNVRWATRSQQARNHRKRAT